MVAKACYLRFDFENSQCISKVGKSYVFRCNCCGIAVFIVANPKSFVATDKRVVFVRPEII